MPRGRQGGNQRQRLLLGGSADFAFDQPAAHGHRLLVKAQSLLGPALIVPHLLRGTLGHDNRLLVPSALVGGATFLLLADTLARNVIAPAELSVGVITSLCGAPFFVYLLRTRYRATP